MVLGTVILLDRATMLPCDHWMAGNARCNARKWSRRSCRAVNGEAREEGNNSFVTVEQQHSTGCPGCPAQFVA
eukprot:4805361-Amphidinium_carterae.1